MTGEPLTILLVEDNPDHAELVIAPRYNEDRDLIWNWNYSERAITGQASTHRPQEVQRTTLKITACLRNPVASSVIIFSGQTATQRPQPLHFSTSTDGKGGTTTVPDPSASR
jgi:hypothetical protein